MDIEKFSNLEVDTASTKSISDACNEMKKLENEIDQAEEVLSLKKAKYKDYQERKIPEPCLLYTSPSPRDGLLSRMPSSA